MAEWRVTEDVTGSSIWDGDRPIGTVDKDVAHRMAAAQEMLAALEAAGFLIAAGPMSDYVEMILSQINAAIDKAKGA